MAIAFVILVESVVLVSVVLVVECTAISIDSPHICKDGAKYLNLLLEKPNDRWPVTCELTAVVHRVV